MVAKRPVLAAIVATLLLSGCTLDPAYHRPALPTQARFPQADAADVAETGRVAADTDWRVFFVDPKLRALIELGLANNRDLRVAVANIQAARAQYGVQRANLAPQINASFGATYGREPLSALTGGASAGGGSVDEHQYTASIASTAYEVDLFGRVRSLTRAALEQYMATEEARRAAQISVVSEIATAYLTLASDEAILQVAGDTVASAEASLDITRKRFTGGVASQLDVRQAQSLVEQARADVANDTTLVAQDRNALQLVVGSPIPDALAPPPLGDDPLVLTDPPAGLPSDVLVARPDVLEAEHQLKSQNAQIGAARAAFFPKITLTGSDGGTSVSLTDLFKGPAHAWSFEPQITLPIFDGGANRANLDYAKAERSVYVAQYEKAIQTAFRDVANALARRATIDQQLDALRRGVAASSDSLTLSQARFDRGSDTYLNVLIAQRTLYAARQSLISARLVRSTNLVSLYQALGGGAGPEGSP
jgi:multidrug efflux system outer membrane protein